MTHPRRFSRRQALAAGLMAPAAGLLTGALPASEPGEGLAASSSSAPAVRTGSPRRIVVIGAGAFGGWTALWLRRQGRDFTLVDTWGPGNARASSGGDTRVIRHAYDRREYVDLVSRSMALWRDSERRWSRSLLHRTGMVWMVQADAAAGSDDPDGAAYEKAALAHLQAAGISHGPPVDDGRHDETALPVWADHGERFWYGIPGSERRGFKVADDTRGESFDPTSGERTSTAEGLRRARTFMERRFPGMKGAPLVEARVCQYEGTPDSHYILDRHPRAGNAWILGGGSGHGFKNGPALGELAAEAVLDKRAPDALFSLSRLAREGEGDG